LGAHDFVNFLGSSSLKDHHGDIENEETNDLFMGVLGMGEFCH